VFGNQIATELLRTLVADQKEHFLGGSHPDHPHSYAAVSLFAAKINPCLADNIGLAVGLVQGKLLLDFDNRLVAQPQHKGAVERVEFAR